MNVSVNEPDLSGNEKRYLAECVDTGWISSEGPFVERLERGMAARCGRAHGVAVCNGSAALDAAVMALGLPKGSEVILPSFTIISCAAAVLRAGLVPVLADSLPDTWNMDVASVEAKITPNTRAVMAVHIYGMPVDMAALCALASARGLLVIEDAAEAIGQTCSNKACGGWGHVSCLSFYPNKHVTTGEGGMILCDDDALAERCRSLRNLCFAPPRRFVHDALGFNFRMSNLQAAVGMAQLERLDASVSKKRSTGAMYQSLLKGVRGLRLPVERTEYAENIYWVFGLVLEDGFGAEDAAVEFERRLKERGVGTRPFFWPMHEQPVFQKMGMFRGERYPVAEAIARRGFYIPSGLAMTDVQIEYCAEAVRSVAEELA
ncbi:MAG: DegT/DnrJ/EryC1/StrS family aminotransferase [Synergistaceae bacterium]|jgi:perosamine synthetase|nr:DegT/DnrJ/EryC1/StrS family aminotransferase [Synergistaceae bacterium]